MFSEGLGVWMWVLELEFRHEIPGVVHGLVMPVRFHHQMVSLKSTSRTQFVAVLKDTALRSNNQSSVDIE